jgi:hypothetical protein
MVCRDHSELLDDQYAIHSLPSMNPRQPVKLQLIPERGVDIVAGETVALACPAWLRIEPIGEPARRTWIKLRYSSSFFDEPLRPLIRFITKNGDVIAEPMNGPALGSAEWIGRIPDGAMTASISRYTAPVSSRFGLIA